MDGVEKRAITLLLVATSLPVVYAGLNFLGIRVAEGRLREIEAARTALRDGWATDIAIGLLWAGGLISVLAGMMGGVLLFVGFRLARYGGRRAPYLVARHGGRPPHLVAAAGLAGMVYLLAIWAAFMDPVGTILTLADVTPDDVLPFWQRLSPFVLALGGLWYGMGLSWLISGRRLIRGRPQTSPPE